MRWSASLQAQAAVHGSHSAAVGGTLPFSASGKPRGGAWPLREADAEAFLHEDAPFLPDLLAGVQ